MLVRLWRDGKPCEWMGGKANGAATVGRSLAFLGWLDTELPMGEEWIHRMGPIRTTECHSAVKRRL